MLRGTQAASSPSLHRYVERSASTSAPPHSAGYPQSSATVHDFHEKRVRRSPAPYLHWQGASPSESGTLQFGGCQSCQPCAAPSLCTIDNKELEVYAYPLIEVYHIVQMSSCRVQRGGIGNRAPLQGVGCPHFCLSL